MLYTCYFERALAPSCLASRLALWNIYVLLIVAETVMSFSFEERVKNVTVWWQTLLCVFLIFFLYFWFTPIRAVSDISIEKQVQEEYVLFKWWNWTWAIWTVLAYYLSFLDTLNCWKPKIFIFLQLLFFFFWCCTMILKKISI